MCYDRRISQIFCLLSYNPTLSFVRIKPTLKHIVPGVCCPIIQTKLVHVEISTSLDKIDAYQKILYVFTFEIEFRHSHVLF